MIAIRIEIGLDVVTRALADRALAVVEGKYQKQIDDLAAQLNASTGALNATAKAHPDPNPND